MSEEITGLEDISDVGPSKADTLREAGSKSVDDIQAMSQFELAEVSGIENASVARIRADVGGLEVSDEVEVEIGGESEAEPEEEETETIETELQPCGHADGKLQLDDETAEALTQERREGKPQFNRQDYHKEKRAPTLWHRPRGGLSKQCIGIKDKGTKVEAGYRTPKATCGLHPSGFERARVFNTGDLEGINGDTQAVHIAFSVGVRKREYIEGAYGGREVHVLNSAYVKARVGN